MEDIKNDAPVVQPSGLASIIVILVLMFLAWRGIDWFIHYKTAKDSESSVAIALENKDYSSACFSAKVAASTHLSRGAKDDYAHWLKKSKEICGE